MFLIRKTALEMLTYIYLNCNENLTIDNPLFKGMPYSDDEFLKSLHYLNDAQFIKLDKNFHNSFPKVGKVVITAKGIDWVEDNLNQSE